jgi:cofilin
MSDAHTRTSGERLVDKNRPISGVALILPEACVNLYQDMKLRKKHKFIIYKVGEETIEAETIGNKTDTLESFKKALPFSDCRFGLYDHEYQSSDGRPQSKIYMIVWLPSSATPYSKMAYAAGKPLFDEVTDGVYDAQVHSQAELDTVLGIEVEEEDNEFNEDDF